LGIVLSIGHWALINRILATHVGSLPRPKHLVDLLFAHDRDEAIDPALLDGILQHSVNDVVRLQEEAALDVVSDGEMSKISYATYIRHRLTGFEGDSARPTPQDLDDFPRFRDQLVSEGHSPTYRRPVCTGPIGVKDCGLVTRDIARLQHALAESRAGSQAVAGFMTSVSPGTIGVFHPNQHYRSHEAYMRAVSAAMRSEYEEIVSAGFILQIDCPDLAMGRHSRFKHMDDAQFLRMAEIHVDVLNDAVAGIPADRMRMHVCWGNYEGPHTHDIPLQTILPVLFNAKPSALVIEGANPRHEHEWEIWETHALPDDKILVPGVIDTSTNYVEHPALVAQRITRYANVVGRDRVMAGTDCGLGTFAGFGPVDPEIAWAKLRSLTDGAALASSRLWKYAASAV
jgi:5-methyltetrahydropteroyltriglutamate--homocysteine methyltransferase